jgi:hypothetical protein
MKGKELTDDGGGRRYPTRGLEPRFAHDHREQRDSASVPAEDAAATATVHRAISGKHGYSSKPWNRRMRPQIGDFP